MRAFEYKREPGQMFFLIAGPCVVENETMPLQIAAHLKEITAKLGISFIFKASYRKANRSKLDSFTGIGDEKALDLLAETGEKLNIPVTTDIHSVEEAELASRYVDMIQIPAFLCRQTDLLTAAGRTGLMVNIKKGQFSSPHSMGYAVEKVRSTGNTQVFLTERGTTFGYHDLIVDFRGIPEMQRFEVPVIVDVTHSLQIPNQPAGVSGGRPELIPLIARTSIAAGCDGIFMEVHPNPESAKSDGANMLRLDKAEALLKSLVSIRKALE